MGATGVANGFMYEARVRVDVRQGGGFRSAEACRVIEQVICCEDKLYGYVVFWSAIRRLPSICFVLFSVLFFLSNLVFYFACRSFCLHSRLLFLSTIASYFCFFSIILFMFVSCFGLFLRAAARLLADEVVDIDTAAWRNIARRRDKGSPGRWWGRRDPGRRWREPTE